MDSIERALQVAEGTDSTMQLEKNGIVLSENAVEYARGATEEELDAQITAMEGVPAQIGDGDARQALLAQIRDIREQRFGDMALSTKKDGGETHQSILASEADAETLATIKSMPGEREKAEVQQELDDTTWSSDATKEKFKKAA